MVNHEHLTVCLPEKNSDEFSVTVKPSEVKVIKYKIGSAGNGGYSLSLSSSTSVSLG